MFKHVLKPSVHSPFLFRNIRTCRESIIAYTIFLCAGSPLPCAHLRGRRDRDLQDLFRVLECTGIRFVPREPIPFKCTTSDWHFTVSADPSQETNVPLSVIQGKSHKVLSLRAIIHNIMAEYAWFSLMLRVKLPVVDRIHPQSNNFATGMKSLEILHSCLTYWCLRVKACQSSEEFGCISWIGF